LHKFDRLQTDIVQKRLVKVCAKGLETLYVEFVVCHY